MGASQSHNWDLLLQRTSIPVSIHETCSKWECELLEFKGEADHVHLLIDYHPKLELSKFIANLKTVSSRLLRKDYMSLKKRKAFWTGSYFVASCGGVTVEQLRRYVEDQTRLSE